MHRKLIFRVAIASLFYYITQQEINATKPANLLHHNSMKKSKTLYLSLTITGISLLINIPAYGKSHAIQSTSTYAFLGIGSLIIALLIFIAIKIYKKNLTPFDPIAEADVYLAYGRKEQAIEILQLSLNLNYDDKAILEKINSIKN